MRVLVACEFSGIVREAFKARGHDAWSCDLLPAEDGSLFHLHGRIQDFLGAGQRWDLMIAHPPCTRLANSGVQWLETRGLWAELDAAAGLFKLLLNAPIPKICIENPIPHKYAVERIGRKYDQIIQPWMFGHMERKATCLWLKGLPALMPTCHVGPAMLKLPKREQQRLHYLPPSENRAQERARTFEGIAKAMAEQWS